MANSNDYSPKTGNIVGIDNQVYNVVDLLGGGTPVDDKLYDITQFQPKSGLVIGSDNRMYDLVELIKNASGNTSSIPMDVLTCSAQSLTDEQQDQARANIGAASDSEVDQLKPDDPPDAAGKVLRVLAVNEDGTFTCEWADAGGGLPETPSQWPEWISEERTTARHRIGVFDTTDLVDIAEYTMDSETLRYVFPSFADYRLLGISFYKAYKSTSGLSGNVWLRISDGTGWNITPSYSISHFILDASAEKSIIGIYGYTNNAQVASTISFLTVDKTNREIAHRGNPFFSLPNAEYAAYYAECNTVIKVRGIPR